MILVTTYPNSEATQGRSIYLHEWISPAYKRYQSTVKAIREEGPQEEKEILKNFLPLFTPSGTFSYLSPRGLVRFSGLMLVKFDNVPLNHGYAKMVAMSENPHCYYFASTVDGAGCYALVSVAMNAPDFWDEYQKGIQPYFGELAKFIKPAKIHEQVPYSWDPDAALNENALLRPFVLLPHMFEKK